MLRQKKVSRVSKAGGGQYKKEKKNGERERNGEEIEEYIVTPLGELTGVQSNHFQSYQMKFSLGINFLSI